MEKEVLFASKFPKTQQKTFFTGNGNIFIGKDCRFGFKTGGFNYKGSIELQARYEHSKIIIGDNVAINNNVFICAANKIEIGDNTLFGQNISLMDHEAHGINPTKRRQVGTIGEIKIGKNAWIGNNVIILKNSIIGENSIIAAGAVVSGKFPSNVIIGGVPAKIIKKIDV